MMDLQLMVVDPMKAMVVRLVSFLPYLLGAVLVLLVGWIAARVLQGLLVRALKKLGIDQLARRVGVEAFLERGAVGHTTSELLGIFLYWLIMLVALATAINVLGLTATAELLDRILRYIPEVVSGIIILILGTFFASVLGTLVQTVTATAGIKQAHLLGQVTRVVLVLFAVEVALEKFIGTTILHTQLTVLLAAAAFGTALAFGLGCKDLAGRFMEEMIERFRRG